MTRATDEEGARALAHLRALGNRCAIRTDHDPGDQPLSVACADPDGVGARLRAVAAALGTGEPRVAASALQYALAERLWAVVVAAWSHHRLIVDVSAFRVGPDLESWSLAAPRPRAWRTGHQQADQVAAAITRLVLAPLAALHRTIRVHTRIAEGLLWGNAATAATLALPNIGGESRARARSLVSAVLGQDPLRDRLDGPVNGVATRRSCCLYYRTRDPRPCGDCPLSESTVARLAARVRRSR